MMNIEFSSNKPYLFRAILDWLLDNNTTPYILVDTSKLHVKVPNEHIKDNQIVLNINPSAVQNWQVDNHAISFSARFSGIPRQIHVPMNALMAVYSQENGQGMVFPVQDQDEVEGYSVASKKDELSLVSHSNSSMSDELNEGALKENEAAEKSTENNNKKKTDKKVSHLKVIK